MEAPEYSLSWNLFHSNVSDGFKSLFREQDLVDVTLAADGKYFKAHKMVLSICSPYFRALFQANPCKHPIVMLQDVNHSILKSILMYMYHGEVKVSHVDLPAFLKLAEVLKVKGLTEAEGHSSPETTKLMRDNDCPLNGTVPQFESSDNPLRPRHRSKTPKFSSAIEATKVPVPRTSCSPIPSTSALHLPRKRQKHDASDIEVAENDWNVSKDVGLSEEAAVKSHQQPPKFRKQKFSPLPNALVKEEPNEPPDPSTSSRLDEHSDNIEMDVNSLMATSLVVDNEDVRLNAQKNTAMHSGDEGHMTDSEHGHAGGRVMLLKSRRGLPVLIHDGHIYTKHKVEASRTLWLCVKQHNLQCGGCLATGLTEQNVLSFSGHNHRQLHDIIKRLQTAGGAVGSESSNCGSSSNSSPSHSHDRHDFPLEPTDLSLPSAQTTQSSHS